MQNVRKNKFKKIEIILISITTIIFIILFVWLLSVKPELKLDAETIMVEVGSEYSKPNIIAKYLGIDISKNVSETGNVDTTKLGEYLVTYKVKEGINEVSKTLKVVVKDEQKPTLTLNGSENVDMCDVNEYEEEGYTALDNYDGDITDKVQVIKEKNKIIYKIADSSSNISVAVRNFKSCDETEKNDNESKFSLTLNGSETLYVPIGTEYVEYGATAYDEIDKNVEVNISGSVDESIAGHYEIVYSATNSKEETITKIRNVYVFDTKTIQNLSGGEKGVIYLTFDDGPGVYTDQILDILKKYDIKATFFVTNGGSEDVIKREYEEGHSVGLHTATHKWNIYTSVDTYFEDLNSVSNRVESITGEKTYLIRFPGGSSNTVSRRYKKGIMTALTSEVLNEGYHYFDWNVSVEDAGSCVKQKNYDKKKECVQNYFKRGLSKNRSNVVLMHDIKKYTADSLEEMINYAISKGYTFDRITMNTEQIHQRVNN